MSEENEFILSNDRKKLAVHHWPVNDPEAVICIVHGLGEHGGRYAPLAEHLVSQGVAVVALDVRGHGLSEGKRGHSSAYQYLMNDIQELLKFTRSEYTEARMFLFGHSFGGNMVASFLRTQNSLEISGFILSSPFFDVAFRPPEWKVKLAHWIQAIAPGITLSNEVDASAISRDEQEVEKYTSDPLIHDRLSARMFIDVMKQGQAALTESYQIETPGLVYHGDADRLASFSATEAFVKKHDAIHWVPLSEVYHEPHNDLGRETVYELIADFLKRHSTD